MSIEIKVPSVGESVQEVEISQWLKQVDDFVEEDEALVELETDKASLEVYAPRAGRLAKIVKPAGSKVAVGEVLGLLDTDAAETGKSRQEDQALEGNATSDRDTSTSRRRSSAQDKDASQQDRRDPVPRASAKPADKESTSHGGTVETGEQSPAADEDQRARERHSIRVTPSARRSLRELGLEPGQIAAQGERLDRADIEKYRESAAMQSKGDRQSTDQEVSQSEQDAHREDDEIVPMSLIRRRIASRLVQAQQQAALLTTFNEIDMQSVIGLRQKYGERFQERYDVKLGFMSFFVKAVVEALKRYPEVNAEVLDDDKIVYHHYFDIGIAIGAPKGLVVPVLRHAEHLSFAEIEQQIADFSRRAQQKKLEPSELEGGTFTISNGGVYGSLLSTPIVNPPQSGVLGMHAIEDRPVVRDGQVVVRPMMYVALSYDHRIVDGRQAVSFLRHVKSVVEEPAQILIEV